MITRIRALSFAAAILLPAIATTAQAQDNDNGTHQQRREGRADWRKHMKAERKCDNKTERKVERKEQRTERKCDGRGHK
jgi:hypothetical protein